MGRKALQGLAHNACQIFLGYQVYNDLPNLEQLGEGRLCIDILTGDCTKDSLPVGPLAIATLLNDWLSQQLTALGLVAEDIGKANLAVDYTFRKGDGYWHEDTYFPSTRFFFQCSSTIEALGRE
jgi:hypothetical protein